jgi:hypothetical protein
LSELCAPIWRWRSSHEKADQKQAALYRYPPCPDRLNINNCLTCKARDFKLTKELPVGLTSDFYEDPAKISLWNGFSRRAGLTIPVGNLKEVIIELRKNLLPILERIGSIALPK